MATALQEFGANIAAEIMAMPATFQTSVDQFSAAIDEITPDIFTAFGKLATAIARGIQSMHDKAFLFVLHKLGQFPEIRARRRRRSNSCARWRRSRFLGPPRLPAWKPRPTSDRWRFLRS